MSFDKYYSENQDKIIEELFEYLSFKTISTRKDSLPEMKACISWLTKHIESIGFTTKILETPDYPTIYAEDLNAGPNQPTLLLYGHYDVQPADPLDLWESDPFKPYIKDNNIFARGVADNKAQFWYTLNALKAVKKLHGELPINIKLVIEGSEECASNGLIQVIDQHQNLFKADSVLIVDSGFESLEKPAISLGCRGVVELEVKVTGPKFDVHSGLFGGIIKNPITELSRAIASFHNTDGSIAIDGFYDDLETNNPELIDALNFEFDEKFYSSLLGAPLSGGEERFKHLERAWLRPTIELNGIIGGYTDEGIKTIIPSYANAKLSSRIVAGQKPEKIKQLIKTHLEKHLSKDFKVEIHSNVVGGGAVLGNPNSEIAKITMNVMNKVNIHKTRFIMMGGSIPIAPKLHAISGGEILLIGYATASDQVHSPNEHFGLDRIKLGFLTIANIICDYGKVS